MSYPGAKVHRVNRRKLGRGQYPTVNAITTTISGTGGVITLTFAQPVNVSGVIPISIAGGGAFVSQTIVSSTSVTQSWTGVGASAIGTLAANPANVMGQRGQGIAGSSGVV